MNYFDHKSFLFELKNLNIFFEEVDFLSDESRFIIGLNIVLIFFYVNIKTSISLFKSSRQKNSRLRIDTQMLFGSSQINGS